MILGDPFKFAIMTSMIEEWNADDTFCNGILFFCVDGEIFPKRIISSTLKYEINVLEEMLSKICADTELFTMEKKETFKKIYNITFPEDINIDNNYSYYITPSSLLSEGCHVFAVRNDTQVRILAAELNYIVEESRNNLSDLHVSEIVISKEELNEIASNLQMVFREKKEAGGGKT